MSLVADHAIKEIVTCDSQTDQLVNVQFIFIIAVEIFDVQIFICFCWSSLKTLSMKFVDFLTLMIKNAMMLNDVWNEQNDDDCVKVFFV